MNTTTARVTAAILFTIAIATIGWLSSVSPVKTEEKYIVATYEIISLRVDDDAQYHFTAYKKHNGKVVSYHDYKDYYDIDISFSSVSRPQLYIKFKEIGYNEYAQSSEVVRIVLPFDYKIETFSDSF